MNLAFLPNFPLHTARIHANLAGMRIFHTTTESVLASILENGLLVSKCKGKIPAVWLHATRLGPWACRHMLARAGVEIEGLVRLTVDVPRSWLTRRGRGVWYCRRDIPPGRIKSVARFGVVSEVAVG